MSIYRLLALAIALPLTACGSEPTEDGHEPTGPAFSARAVSPCAPAWAAAQVYTGGQTASQGNVNYKANWWTQGNNPATSSGGPGSGQPWTNIGSCSGQTGTTPSAPAPAPAPKPSAPVTSQPPAKAAGFAYSAYKDVTINANWNTYVISTAVNGAQASLLSIGEAPAITWSFATGECGSENWGGIQGQALASANVQAWAAAKKPYIISTGGAAGSFTCGSDAGFAAFMDRYLTPYLLGVDFDIEAGQTPAQIAALVQRVKTAQGNAKYKNLRYSFTIATLGGNVPQSLGQAGVNVMQAIKQAGLSNYYINLMAMDYGSSTPQNCTQGNKGQCAMGQSAVQAAINLHQAYGVPYSQIELTTMIGGNDTPDETFTLADVDTVVAFAKLVGLGGVHYWSFDRDKDCAPGYASPICNSYGQAGALGFARRFAKGLR